ncbi:hypothetical protein SB48_HM08orf01285 [Heyndrickxia coagulans]|uniref:Uncharacterized protein n=1 Tax=Heyndrickxia coagulans TaxID=1398 RepID=A0AAN0T2R6_HEYCO|nr:hypothetical protein SB48_HM08orf01285 [Heyndrickxia coagulans]
MSKRYHPCFFLMLLFFLSFLLSFSVDKQNKPVYYLLC